MGTHHRPSDDLSTFGTLPSVAQCDAVAEAVAAFLTPANAMLSVELGHLADILDSAKQARNASSLARTWSARISDAIWNTTVCNL